MRTSLRRTYSFFDLTLTWYLQSEIETCTILLGIAERGGVDIILLHAFNLIDSFNIEIL